MNKPFCFFFAVLLFSCTELNAQNFGDNSPVWNYSVSSGFWAGGLSYHLRLSVEKDTTFLGKQCKILTSGKRGIDNYMPYKNMVCQDSSKVVFWSPSLSEFQTLYDFSAKKGKSWKAKLDEYNFGDYDFAYFLVDSIYTQTINNRSLITQSIRFGKDSLSVHTDELSHVMTVIESIGCTQFLFPWDYSGLDGDYVDGIRCYVDDSIGFFKFQKNVACNYTQVGVNETLFSQGISVFPNPNKGKFSIHGIHPNGELNSIEIMDLQGKVIPINYSMTNEGISISIQNIKSGLYFIKLELSNGEFIREKVIVQD